MIQDTPVEIHVTEIDWFFECGYRWSRERRIGDWAAVVTLPFARGGAVHAARAYALDHWKQHRAFPSLEDLRQAGRRDVVGRMGGDDAPWDPEQGDHFFLDEETAEKVYLEAVVDEADPYIRFDVAHVLPRYLELEIVACEERSEVPIRSGELQHEYVLTGQVDLLGRERLSGRLANHDLKTGAKLQQRDADLRAQLSGYSALIHRRWGEWPLHALGCPRFLKGPPKEVSAGAIVEQIETAAGPRWGVYETITTDRNEEDVQAFLARLELFLQMSEAGWFPVAPAGFFSPCHRCPHATAHGSQACPYTSTAGGKIR